MDNNRFPPYGSPRDQPRQPPPGNNVNLEEALYFQRRQELQRDLQLRQMLLQGQIDRQQQNMHQQRMYELQQFGAQQALANLQRDEQMQADLRRRQLGLSQQMRPSLPLSAPIGSPIRRPPTMDPILTTDVLDSTAARLPSGNRKRSTSNSNRNEDQNGEEGYKRARKESFSSSSKNHSDALLLAEASMENMHATPAKPKVKRKRGRPRKNPPPATPETSEEAQAVEAFRALSASKNDALSESEYERIMSPIVMEEYTKGTIESLLEAGKAEQEVDEAATVMVTLKDIGELSESEPEDHGIASGGDDNEFEVSISVPGFQSKLPQLPVEPEFNVVSPRRGGTKASSLKKSPEKKSDQGTDDETNVATEASPSKMDENGKETSPSTKKVSPGKEQASSVAEDGDTIRSMEYPYPVDTWWPSIPTIRRERKMKGEVMDDENFLEESGYNNEDARFSADVRTIQARLGNDVQPGVLEKIPHCKIHRMRIRSKKGANIPDHAFCWQVTETYCNDIMVCCSICGTWRHAACGGHYNPYSVRENIRSKEPFVAICDLCHEEEGILQDFPKGEARLERQRIEQLRRALGTSAIIRQAAFVKFGGTYKWPLGSVSNTHIGGHTRSVHTRHDKAEKTWTEMTSRLSRGPGYRPKERIKVRTREFERLLMGIEDAEGLRDRHNMIQFLENDLRKEDPAGYEKHLRNIFDPDDDENPEQQEEVAKASSQDSQEDEDEDPRQGLIGHKPPASRPRDDAEASSQNGSCEAICARKGCCKVPRFDSVFCSDSCGVLELERDLLRTMYLAEEIHPSLLRSG